MLFKKVHFCKNTLIVFICNMTTLRFSLQGNSIFELTFDITATIRTAKVFLSHRYNTIPDNISLTYNNLEFADTLLLTEIKIPKNDTVLIFVRPSRNFQFLQPGKEVFILPFLENATVNDAKRALSPKLKVIPERINLSYDNQDLLDDLRLIDLNIPEHRFISVDVSDDQIPVQKYIFMLQGEAKELPFCDSATIGEVKEFLISSSDEATAIGNIRLYFDGKPLFDDKQTIGSLKIQKGDFIIAQTNKIICKELRDEQALKLPEVDLTD